MADEGTIHLEVDGYVLVMTIDRVAKRNSLTPKMMADLSLAFDRLTTDPGLRCGVLGAAGDHFTAGLDLLAFLPLMQGSVPTPEAGEIDALQLKQRCPKPLIAALKGITLTVGIELALACDFAIAGTNTKFAQLETKRGIMVSGGGTVRWVQRAGLGNAMYHLLRGDQFDAAEALRIGLVQEVVEDGEVDARARALAHEIAANAPLAVEATKASVLAYLADGEQSALSSLAATQSRLTTSADAVEGATAMMQKREPVFRRA